MVSSPSLSPIETISADLRMILRGVLAVLGMWRLQIPQMVLAHRRISAAFRGIECLLERFRAGRLWRVAHRTQGQKLRGRKAGRGPALPRKFGWLVLAGGHQAAGFGLQLQTVLSTPEMLELLAASPQAGRILRPLCRALALEVPGVIVKSATERGETKPRRRKPRVRPEPFRIPLPRGVLSAARRQGFGKMC
jgi:hypothetical protein